MKVSQLLHAMAREDDAELKKKYTEGETDAEIH